MTGAWAGGFAVRARPPGTASTLVGYGAPVVAAAASTVTWFSPGRFVATGDVPPYLRTGLAAELGQLWNHQVTGAGSTSYAVVQALDVVLLEAAAAVGAPPAAAQRGLFALCVGFAAFGAAYLAGAVVRRPAGRIAAGLLGAFNAFLLVNYPNLLPAVAVGLTGLLAGMVLRAARGGPPGSAGGLPGSVCGLSGSVRGPSGSVGGPEAEQGNRDAAVGRAGPGVGRRWPLWFALATTPAAYLAQNPPLLLVSAVAVTAVAACAGLAIPGGTRRALALLLRAAPLVLVLNLWWIVPYAQVVLFGGAGLAFTAHTDVATWQWTQVRADLANVLTLNASWGWDLVEYFPYGPVMRSGLWPYLSWLPVVLAAAGLVATLARRRWRRAGVLLVVALVLLVGLAKGMHPPLGQVNRWLYDHVPGAWLLREPMSKLGVLFVLCYAVLAAVAVEHLPVLAGRLPALAARVPAPAARAGRRVGRAWRPAVLVLVAGAVAYPWPLWTGAVVPETGVLLPPARVSVPDGWHRLAAELNTAADRERQAGRVPGKVLVLPLNPYYQMNTAWGYYGTDTVPAQLLRQPVLQRYPGGYFAATARADALLARVQTELLAGDTTGVPSLLRALGVSHVVLRQDLRTSAYTSAFADPGTLLRGLRRTAGLVEQRAYPVAVLFRQVTHGGPVRVAPRLVQALGEDDSTLAGTVAAAPPDAVVAPDGDVAAGEMRWRGEGRSAVGTITVSRPGRYRIDRISQGAGPSGEVARYRATRIGSELVLRDAQQVMLDGRPLPPRPPLRVRLDRPDVSALVVDGRSAAFHSGGVEVLITRNSALTAYRPGSAGRPLPARRFTPECPGTGPGPHWVGGGDGSVSGRDGSGSGRVVGGDGSASGRDGSGSGPAGGGDASGSGRGGPAGGALRLVAGGRAACAVAEVPDAGPGVYRLSLAVRTSGETAPAACLWQVGPGGCVPLPAPPPAPSGWRRYAAVAAVPAGVHGLRLFLRAPAGGEAQYRDMWLEPLRRAGGARLASTAAPGVWRQLAAGGHRVEVRPADGAGSATGVGNGAGSGTGVDVRDGVGSGTGAGDGVVAGASPRYAAGGGVDLLECPPDPGHPAPLATWTGTGAGNRAGREVTLSARSGVGCLWADLGPAAAGARYRLSLDYRTLSGRAARVCLWQVGPDRCVESGALEQRTAWRHLAVTVRPAAGTRRLYLYLYVDGQPTPPTTVAYRDVLAEPDVPVLLRFRADAPAPPPPTVTATGGGESYRVRVTGASGAFVLALAESYAPGWRLTGLPAGWRARHVHADGYGNGWLVEGTGDASLAMAYAPARWARAATVVSGVSAALLALLLLLPAALARARKRARMGLRARIRMGPRMVARAWSRARKE